jgi:hypothetical protein
MAKPKRDEVTYQKFLSEPRNFEIAVEVFGHFEEVRTYLQEKYWTTVRRFLENHKLSQKFGKWKVTDDGAAPADKYYGIAFDPSAEVSSVYCRACLEQGEPGHRFPIRFGIAWSEETPRAKEPDVPELHILRKHLREERGMTKPTQNWWIARGEPGYELHSADVLTQLARDNTIQRLQADEFVQFFLETRKMVERLNAKIAKSS